MAEETIPDDYLKSIKAAEFYITLARGSMGFRYGPYTALEAGKIMNQCLDEEIPFVLIGACGREFDWDVARDFAKGVPVDGDGEAAP